MRIFAGLLLYVTLLISSSAGPTANAPTKRQDIQPKVNKHLRPNYGKRQSFNQGEPINAKGNGAPILGKSEFRLAMVLD